MRTTYNLALNNIGFSLGDSYIKNNEANGQTTLVGAGNSFYLLDVHNFSDRMSIDNFLSRDYSHGFSFEHQDELILNASMFYPIDPTVGIGSTYASGITTTYYNGYETIKGSLENVTKAMLCAVLEDNAKRGFVVGIGSTEAKKRIFYNSLATYPTRNYSIKPWSNWNNPIGICTPSFISRTNNVAIVTTTFPHGMTTSYDDWGVIMNLNTGIATSFNISTSIYPNGVPIKIINSTTFSYQNIGINTSSTSVSGIASITVGWGGTSNNFHIQITY